MRDFNLVLVRHGQSEWNKSNRFTGWEDIPLSSLGKKEAKQAGQWLKKNLKFLPDQAFTSVLSRAVWTSWIILDELSAHGVPLYKTWRLNERHYGKLTGMNKNKAIKQYGEEQVKLWRRSYDSLPPPALKQAASKYKTHDPPPPVFSESLKCTEQRLTPLWNKQIKPLIFKGQNILICAHGNSLRALIKLIENIPAKEISDCEVPTAAPLAYHIVPFKNKKHPKNNFKIKRKKQMQKRK